MVIHDGFFDRENLADVISLSQHLNITRIGILGKKWNSSPNFRLFKRLMKSSVIRNNG